MKKYVFLYDDSIYGDALREGDVCGYTVSGLSEYVSESGKARLIDRTRTAYLIDESLKFLLESGVISSIGHLKKHASGKPFLSDSGLKISISQSDGVSAVAFSADGEIGIDIEAEIPPQRADRIRERYLSALSFCEASAGTEQVRGSDDAAQAKLSFCGEADICVYALTNVGFASLTLALSDGSVTEKWTVLEAILKCDGRGFAALDCADELARETDVISFIYAHGDKKYYLSLAQRCAD